VIRGFEDLVQSLFLAGDGSLRRFAPVSGNGVRATAEVRHR
jgi:hypothetical protein